MDHHSNQYLFYCIRLYIHAQLQQALAGNLGVGGGVSSCFMMVLEVFLCETRVAGGKVFWTPRPTPRQFSRAKSLE